jgi:hypothetical protein
MTFGTSNQRSILLPSLQVQQMVLTAPNMLAVQYHHAVTLSAWHQLAIIAFMACAAIATQLPQLLLL